MKKKSAKKRRPAKRLKKRSRARRQKKTAGRKKISRRKKIPRKKAAAKKAKRAAFPKTAPPAKETIERLLKKGRQRGFLTETEVLHVFFELEDYLETYEDFLDLVERAGFNVIETKDDLLLKKDERKELFKKANLEKSEKQSVGIDLVDALQADSIQMYLREIGKIPLLRKN